MFDVFVVLVSNQPLEAVQREEHGMQLFHLLDVVFDHVSPQAASLAAILRRSVGLQGSIFCSNRPIDVATAIAKTSVIDTCCIAV